MKHETLVQFSFTPREIRLAMEDLEALDALDSEHTFSDTYPHLNAVLDSLYEAAKDIGAA